MHQLANAGETPADPAAWVQIGKVFCLPAAEAAYFEGESVAQGEHDGGGGGGCEVEGAGFGGDAGVEEDVARLSQGGCAAARDGDQCGFEALEGWDQAQEFFCFAAVGKGDDDAFGGEHAEITVDGFGRVKEVGRRACGAQGGGDFAGDDAALADAGEDDATLRGCGLKEMVRRLGEWDEHGGVEAEGKFVQGGGLDADEVRRT